MIFILPSIRILKEKYPNIINFKLIVYPIFELNKVLSNCLEKKVNKKFNATINNNFYYLDDLKDKAHYYLAINTIKSFLI